MVEGKSVKSGMIAAVFAAFLIAVVWLLVNFDAAMASLPWIILLGVFLFVVTKYPVLLLLVDYQRAVIFRFGKVGRVGRGWTFVIPFIESFVIVDLRTKTLFTPKYEVITKGNIELKVKEAIFLNVGRDDKSVVSSVVNIKNFEEAVVANVIGATRDVIGDMEIREVVSKIEEINRALKSEVEEISKDWGISILKVEIEDVDIPQEILAATNAFKVAEQEKLARIQKAEAHREEISAVNDAAKELSDKTVAYYYIKALEELSRGQSTKFVLPLELSRIANSISDKIGASTAGEKDIEQMIAPFQKTFEKAVDSAVEAKLKKMAVENAQA